MSNESKFTPNATGWYKTSQVPGGGAGDGTGMSLVGKFKIEGHKNRNIWYDSRNQMYDVTDDTGSYVDDKVPSEFKSLADLRSAYIAVYTNIEFYSQQVNPKTPMMTSGYS